MTRADTMPTSRSTFSAVGPERRRRAMRASSPLDEVPIEIEERECLERRPIAANWKSSIKERLVMGRPPSPAITAWVCCGSPAVAIATSVATIPPAPGASAFSMTTTRRAPAERVSHRRGREGAERADPHYPDARPLLAQGVDGILDGPEHRAQGHDDGLGVLAPVGAHETPRHVARRSPRTPPRSRG